VYSLAIKIFIIK